MDTEALGLVDYFDIIKKPMDLGTVKEKLDTRQYASHVEFVEDVRLIFMNCYRYNHPDTDVVAMAKKLQVCMPVKFLPFARADIICPHKFAARSSGGYLYRGSC